MRSADRAIDLGMKRDKHLMCRVLRHFESQPTYGDLQYLDDPNLDPELVAYHVHLAVQAKYLEVESRVSARSRGLPRYNVQALTWTGHELLDPNGCR